MFLNDLVGKGKISVTDFTRKLSLEEANNWLSTRELHFCAGVKGKRCRVEDVIEKNYFVIDIDLRKDLLEMTELVRSDDELVEVMELLKETMANHSDFNQWRYRVFSGNGCHIYYIGDFIDLYQVDYKATVLTIYHKFNNEIGKELEIECDMGCANINHLFRVPGSLNRKRESYGLDLSPSKILREQAGNHSNLLQTYAVPTKHDKNESYVRSDLSKDSSTIQSTYEYVKENIDVGELFAEHQQLKRTKSGENFISPRDGKHIGVFYNRRQNLLIRYEGSNNYLRTRKKVFNPIEFAKEELGYQDNPIEYFLNRYPAVREVQEKNQQCFRQKLRDNSMTTSLDEEDTQRLLGQCKQD